jgi:hypothetical protein
VKPTLALLACLLGIAVAQADAWPTKPMVRIDTGRHTAFIHALVLDAASGKTFSASEDKTIRVWRTADGRLLDTFRVPAGLQAEGQLYALALSPDGRTLAAAGWTCWDVEKAACIYLLDSNSGDLRARITGLPEIIATLRFSPDGNSLAAGMMGTAGLEVYRVKDRVRIASDREYRGKLLELDFSPQGRLLTSSLDGFVRVYDPQFKLAGRMNAGLAGKEPFGIRYSPDGRYVAVGFNDVAKISILNAADLSVLRTLKLDGPQAPRNLTRVAWNRKSVSLVATGEPIAPQNASVFRWVLTSPSPPLQLPLAHERIGDLAVTADDAVVFAAEDPALGMIEANGRRRYLLLSGVPDYRAAQQSLRVSPDGAALEIALSNDPGALRRFSLTRGELTRPAAPDPTLLAPAVDARGWKIRQAKDTSSFTINGQAPTLDPFETAHAYALAPRAGLLVLGTEWALRGLDSKGVERWSVRMPTAVRAVNVSADEHAAIVVLGDGTIHWYSLQGVLMASAFLHSNGVDWAAWTPQGFYSASPYGDRFVGWQMNRGGEVAPDFFRAVQLERTLYRPDLLNGPFNGTPPPTNFPLIESAPPRVSVELLASTTTTRRIRVRAQSLGLPMKDVSAYVNDIPITPPAGRSLKAGETKEFVREFEVPINATDNTLRVEVFNGSALGEAEKYVPGELRAAPPGDLYVLAVGANKFTGLDADLALNFSAQDADEFAKAIKTAGSGQYRQVHVRTLSDHAELPTRAAVLRALDTLKVAGGNDTIVVFLASHGISDQQGNYYFVPRDAARTDIDALLDGKSLAPVSSLVSWQDVSEALRNTAGRRLLVVDTCQARQISGHFMDSPLLKRSASSRMAFILASKGDEESQEYEQGKHGLFTFGLLEGLAPGITVADWFASAARTVDQLRDRRIGPQTPQLIAPESLASFRLMSATPGGMRSPQ